MTIPHFATQQNLVFVPALTALLVATVAICLPIVFAQTLQKTGRVRVRVVLVVLGIVAGVALVLGAVQGGSAVRTLQEERGALQAEVQVRYGLQITGGEADALIDGDEVLRVLPDVATDLGLVSPEREYPLQLQVIEADGDRYDLTFGGEVLPTR